MSIEPLLPIDSLVGQAVTDDLRRRRDLEGNRPTSDGTRGRGSMARACSRRIALDGAHIPRTKPDADWNFITWQIGQDAHDRIQHGLAKHFGARTEVPVSYRPDHDFSGNTDAVYDVHPLTGEKRANLVTVEIKSMSQYGYDLATGRKPKHGEEPGPKIEHVTQAALYGCAPQLESDWLHLIYYGKDKGLMAEWLLPVDEPLAHLDGNPTPRDLARDELARLDKIFGHLDDDGLIVKPVIPGYGPVADPTNGPWNCDYCPHQATCAALGPEAVHTRLAEETAWSLLPGDITTEELT